MKLIGHGAEAKLYLDATKKTVIKRRIQKTYRHPTLDATLRKQRTRREAKILAKLSDISPTVHDVNETSMEVTLDYVDGPLVKDVLDDLSTKKQTTLIEAIATMIATMHERNIVHGDLTTSNMILQKNTPKLIDFGLSFVTDKIEHKAVDLHVFKHALESKHYKHAEALFATFLKQYTKQEPEAEAILERLTLVEKRGRYKRRMGS